MEAKSVVVIGAGPGVLASAMLLARRGFRVQVFEKAARIGGRTAEVALGQYQFDLGPTFLMMWLAVAVLYLLNVLEIIWYARQLGNFRWTTAWLYPIALSFYFVVFGQSLWRQRLGKSVTWKGRRLWN